jgi:hypothetical protein
MTTATLSRHRWGDPQSRSPRPLDERPSVVERHIFLACLLIGAVIAGIILFTAEYGGVADSYGATIERIVPVGLSQVEVGVEVTNLGSSSATPTCRIEMNSPDRFVTGAGTVKANHPILGGSGTYFETMIPVTTYGASSVTSGASNVSCQ